MGGAVPIRRIGLSIYQPIRIYGASTCAAPLVLDRLGYLTAVAQGRSVLHVGCADWPMTEQRISRGQLLHARLRQTASFLFGIDISKQGLQVLRGHGYSDVGQMDAEDLVSDRKYDLVIAGDTLEHLSNPGLFIQKAADALAPDGEIVIGVPSAFSFNAIRLWFGSTELTHKDHTAFYSPKTLSELCGRFGLVPTKVVFTVQPRDDGEMALFVFVRSCVLRLRKMMAPSIIMHFRKRDSVNRAEYFEWL